MGKVLLDATRRTSEIDDLEARISSKLVGQTRAVSQFVHAVSRYRSGLGKPNRTLGNFLFLGPTGTGKTRLIEVIAECLWGRPDAFIKLHCAEYQHGQSTNRILGATPGYIGYTEDNKNAALSQEKVDQYKTKEWPFSILLLDEIEKADESLFQLLLGMLDKGELTLNNGHKVNLSSTFVIMTSNLGVRESSHKDIGYAEKDLRTKESHTLRAIKSRFSPEFLNRIDETIVFESLSRDDLEAILNLELLALQKRVLISETLPVFTLELSAMARDLIIRQGTSAMYNARELTRVVDKLIINPISNLILSGQIDLGDKLVIDADDKSLAFSKVEGFLVAGSDDLVDYLEE